jgi:hypothetical protein
MDGTSWLKRAHASMIGIHFRPGGALPFVDVPPGELATST